MTIMTNNLKIIQRSGRENANSNVNVISIAVTSMTYIVDTSMTYINSNMPLSRVRNH